MSGVDPAARCLVCGSTALARRFESKGYLILGCSGCGFQQVAHPPDDSELDRLYAGLHSSHARYRDTGAALRENRDRLRLVRRHLPQGASVLDAGCGAGDFLELAHEHYDASGMDVSALAVEQARARIPRIASQIGVFNLDRQDAPQARYDAVCLWDVIEHVRNPVKVLEALLRSLKPGGRLFLSTPDAGSLSARVMGSNWHFMIPPLHLGYFTRRSLETVFSTFPGVELAGLSRRGKWTSVSFVFYKLNQMSARLVPAALMERVASSAAGRCNVYVPTNDIIYLVVKKL